MLAITIILGIIAAAEVSAVIFNHIRMGQANDRLSDSLKKSNDAVYNWQKAYSEIFQAYQELKASTENKDSEKKQE